MGPLDRVARVLTEVLAPSVVVALLPLAVAWAATGAVLPTVGWGLLVAATSSILPMAVIVWGARSGRWDGHHVRNREGRLIPFLVLIGLGLLGLGLLVVLDAPWLVVALDVIMLVLLLASAAITVVWKVSMHTGVVAGATVVMAVVHGPWWWAAVLPAAAVAWSRVRLRDHTTGQVVAGALLGSAVGGLFALLV
ncbi:hypothetical protein [Pseudonocardia sp. HH130630-07]|uniref:hypothetical protein n=1 Tax=Pseudonocardia sp. HH130630-07 TaxID=1690815 RepID=UPI000814E330|nr:hypothetical protein [Pseudonocardia sp. HH130630-07]ANY07520.1 hypothetical protein AFB00_15835 [Pseudonocardia sp. HH130630-07]